ncbi:hypothetical protein [Vibrio alginolyticus]|uniref:hypothetical protein n=1 Tax=Vibrio alginolyticus TaxID=663 RepID=UPI0010509C39|nr:hypothetical protein [Vibrio alginolyticus]TDE43107.1 hypothetical protein E1093_23060 [Vibrio alginolyticus]
MRYLEPFNHIEQLFSYLEEFHDSKNEDLKNQMSRYSDDFDSYLLESNNCTSSDKYTDFYIDKISSEAESELFESFKYQHQMSILEFKVFSICKHSEIKLKKILFEKYNVPINKIRSFKDIVSKFDDNGIQLSVIDGFKELDQLRMVCNDLKHSGKVNSAKNIPNFNGFTDFTVENLSPFLWRKVYDAHIFFTILYCEIAGEKVHMCQFEDDIPF